MKLYCQLYAGMFSSYMTLSLTVWIAIQVNYVLITVYFPLYFYQRKGQKWKRHFVHIVSLLAGIISLIVPAMLTLGLGGYSPLGTKFPPIVCFARKRDITMYIFLIPVAVLIAIIITGLVLIFHFLVR